jgi:hypothetical protein
MLQTFVTKFFETFTLPILFRQVAKFKAPKFWRRAFIAASELTPEFPAEFAVKLAKRPSLLRFLLNTFKIGKPFPTTTDFAVAIGFELNYDEIAIEPVVIRKFATNLRREWCKALNLHPSMKIYLKDIRDVHPAVVIDKDGQCDPDLEDTLSDVLKLRCAYFKSYSESGGTDEVRVYVPNADDYVSYEEKLTVSVMLHSAQGADYGFFRVRQDYALVRSGAKQWLRACHQNEKLNTETAVFQCNDFGNISGPLLWLN